MSRILAAAFLALAVLMPLNTNAAERVKASAYIKSFEYRSNTNRAFLDSAAKIVKDDQEALPYLKMAQAAATESREHFDAGDYEFALEDIAESNQMAMHAVIIAANKGDASIRDNVIREELLIQAKHDIERKEAMLRKGLAEVETFIETSERLLGEDGNEEAAAMLADAREHYEASKLNLAQQNYDTALAEVKTAYRLATRTVKHIKRAQDDIITFPKPAFGDERETLEYELKKNASYEFFASKVVKRDDTESERMLNEATALKKLALEAIDGEKTQEAIKQLQGSTELLIKAIKLTYRED